MLDAVPAPLPVNVPPGVPMGTRSQIDLVNTSTTVAIERVDLSVNINTDPQDVMLFDPCPTPPQFLCNEVSFPIAPTMSRPITVACPNLSMNDTSSRMVSITAHYADGSTSSDQVTVTCTARDPNNVYATNLVFPTTQIGTSSTGTVFVSTKNPTPTMILPMMGPGDTDTFELTSCQQGCLVSNMANATITVKCTPPTPGPHVASFAMETVAGGDITVSTLVCNGTTMSTPMTGTDAGVTGDGEDLGGPDAGGSGPGGSHGAREPQSFYACSTGALSGALPIAVILAVVMLRRAVR